MARVEASNRPAAAKAIPRLFIPPSLRAGPLSKKGRPPGRRSPRDQADRGCRDWRRIGKHPRPFLSSQVLERRLACRETSRRMRRTAMGNPFVHVELATSDVDKAKSFYQSLFDWQLSDVDMGGGMSYTMIQVGEGTGGGMMKQMMPNAPSAWLPYVQVDDIRTATDTAKSLGATIMRDVMEVMDAGWLSIIRDPTGAVLGLWQPKKK